MARRPGVQPVLRPPATARAPAPDPAGAGTRGLTRPGGASAGCRTGSRRRPRTPGLGGASVAVSLLFSFANPDHERKLRAILEEAGPGRLRHACVGGGPAVPGVRAHQHRGGQRVHRPAGQRLRGHHRSRGPRIDGRRPGADHAVNGGVATPAVIARAPVQTLMSGPVAGVVGTRRLCQRIGRENAISLDIAARAATCR